MIARSLNARPGMSRWAIGAVLLFAALLYAPSANAAAPAWRIVALPNSTAAPGSTLDYTV